MSLLTSNSVLDVLILSAIFAMVVMMMPVSASITSPSGAQAYVNATNYATVNAVPGAQYYFYAGTSVPADYFHLSSASYIEQYQDNGDNTWGYAGAISRSSFWTSTLYQGKMKFNIQGTGYFYLYVNTVNDLITPVPDFTYDPLTIYPSQLVTFTDTTTGVFSSGYWDFGDNSTPVSGQNVTTHSYSSVGNYTVSHRVTWTGGYVWSNKTVTVSSYVPPVAAFSCTPLNTTSPAIVTCTDSSTNYPTSWLWQLTSFGVSISPGGSYDSGIFSAVNSTQNPVFNMSGSGRVDVRLTATNPGGSDQEYKVEYITVSGVAPTPTPTPDIPWPNQTGVCQHSGISLGSQQTQAFNVHYQLTDPQGDTFSGQYLANQISLVSGYPFFTALLGQYVYNEYSMVDGSLLWRQSYVVEDCTATPTITSTPTPTQTPFPTFTYTNIPTVPIPVSTIDWEDAEPDTPLDFNVTIPEHIDFPDVPATLPTISPLINEINIINQTCDNTSVLAAIFCPITVSMRDTGNAFNTAILNYLVIPVLSPFVMIITMGVNTMSDFQGMIGLWNVTVSIFRGLIWNAFMSIPPKALNALCVPLIGEILKEIIDWPREVEKK